VINIYGIWYTLVFIWYHFLSEQVASQEDPQSFQTSLFWHLFEEQFSQSLKIFHSNTCLFDYNEPVFHHNRTIFTGIWSFAIFLSVLSSTAVFFGICTVCPLWPLWVVTNSIFDTQLFFNTIPVQEYVALITNAHWHQIRIIFTFLIASYLVTVSSTSSEFWISRTFHFNFNIRSPFTSLFYLTY